MKFLEEYKGRIVAFIITPLVTAGSAALSVWAAKNLPGVELNADQLAEIGVAGAVAALTSAGVWLHNSGKQEEIAAIGVQAERDAHLSQPGE